MNLALGNYRFHRAMAYLVHLSQHEAMSNQEEFEDTEALVHAMKNLPKSTKLFRLAVNEQPEFWTLADFGPWPANGGAIYAIEFPSANRSNTSKYEKLGTLFYRFLPSDSKIFLGETSSKQ